MGALTGLKVYVGGSFLNWREVRELQDLLKSEGAEITYDWTKTAEDLDGKSEQTFAGDRASIAVAELKGVTDAHVMVVRWPGRLGTHLQMGAALARGCGVVMFDKDEKIDRNSVVFYSHPQVFITRSSEVLLAALEMFTALVTSRLHAFIHQLKI